MELKEEEWVGHTMKEAERRKCIAKVLSMERKDAVPKGNNYVSDIYRLKVRVLNNSGDLEERSVIYKVLPSSENKLPDVKENGIFQFESRMYQDTLAAMGRLLKSKDPSSEPLWPEFYGVKGNYEGFLLEDISVLGYVMADRRKGFDLQHCEVALRGIAKFHALAAVGIENGSIQRKDFPETHFMLKDPVRLKMAQEKIQFFLTKAIEEFWPKEWHGYIDGLRKLPDTLVSKIQEMLQSPEESFKTLNHGDFWVNNVMFKYDLSASPKTTRFVDYQFCYYNSPCHDVQYLIRTSLRVEHFDKKHDLLRVYHACLEENLKLFGYGKPAPSFEELCRELERTRHFGYHLGLMMRPVMMNPPMDELVERFGPVAPEEKWYLHFRYDGEDFLRTLRHTLLELREVEII